MQIVQFVWTLDLNVFCLAVNFSQMNTSLLIFLLSILYSFQNKQTHFSNSIIIYGLKQDQEEKK